MASSISSTRLMIGVYHCRPTRGRYGGGVKTFHISAGCLLPSSAALGPAGECALLGFIREHSDVIIPDLDIPAGDLEVLRFAARGGDGELACTELA